MGNLATNLMPYVLGQHHDGNLVLRSLPDMERWTLTRWSSGRCSGAPPKSTHLGTWEWGQCNAGCKADPAGSYIPFSPRRSPASRVSQVNGLRFTHARRGDTVGQLAALIRVINKQKKGPN